MHRTGWAVLALGLAALTVLPVTPVSAGTRYAVSAYASSSTVIAGDAVRLHGRVSPRASRQRIRLQRYRSGGWHTVKTPRLTRRSRYTVWVRLAQHGTTRLRVVKPRGHGHGRGVSRVVAVQVLPTDPPSISTTALPEAPVGIAYTAALRTKGGRAGSWSWQAGYSPPSWLHLGSSTGRLTGTPRSASVGDRSLAVQFTDAVGRTADATVFLTVTAWTSMTEGAFQTCGVRTDHTAWCWGANDFGQSGSTATLGTLDPNPTPTRIGSDSDWLTLTAGDFHTCGIHNDGTAWCWGDNQAGQLGSGTDSGTPTSGTTPSPVPSQVGSVGDWSQLSAGHEHTCGVKTDYTLWCWGANDEGQLGSGINLGTANATPTQVGTETDWATVSAGGRHTCALKTDRTLWCWGADDFGQLGQISASTSTVQAVPLQVAGSWAAIAAGDQFTCATRTDGTLWCWGRNTDGQLGNPTDNGADAPNPDPQQVGSAADWSNLAAGFNHACAVKTDGTAWCWGDNSFGETSTATNTTRSTTTPTRVGTSTSWSDLTAGWGSGCGLKTEGTAWCWGNNDAGQLGSSTNIDTANQNPTPIQLGTG